MRQYPRKVALPGFGVTVAVVWALLHLHHFGRHDLIDTDLALLIGLGAALGVCFMLYETEGWTIRALGVLGYIAGDAVVYAILSGHVSARWLNLGRALLLVGMPFFLIGIGQTIAAQWRARRLPDPADEPRATGLP